jgi:hypothetical protein
MTDLQDLRARARDTSYAPEQKSGVPFWLITAAAIALSFTVVLLAPRFYTKQGTTAFVTHIEPRATAQPPIAPASVTDRYSGKNADEIAKIADAYCASRVRSILLAPLNGEEQSPKAKAEFDRAKQTVANGGNVADHNERLACQLTEAPARYCSPALRQKITAGVIDYFKGIENTNASLRLYFKAQAVISLDASRGRTNTERLGLFSVDPHVIDGVEGLIRAGYLVKAQRDDIGTSVPRPIKERLGRVVSNNAHCPQPPWWAIWR